MLSTEPIQIEISNEDIESWCPMFALPCYDRQLTEPCFMSMIRAAMRFKEIGLKFAVSTISDSLISRARNQLVAKFMANPQFTHLMFIDVDLGFEADDILKLLWHDKDIITGAYPIKEINWNKVSDKAKAGSSPESLLENSLRYVVNPVKPTGEKKVLVENGAIRIYDAGTGFMMIKREAFTKLFKAYPELKYNDDTGSLVGDERDNSYALFNSYVDEDGRFLSEDYGFGRYWQKIDGDVWVDPSIALSHLGRMEYKGTMINWLVENSQQLDDNE